MSGVPSMGCELRVSWTPLDYADGVLMPALRLNHGPGSSEP